MIPIDNKHLPKFIIALPIGFLIMTIIGTYFQNKEWEEHSEVTYQTELKGEIKVAKTNGAVLIEFSNGNKFRLNYSDNYNYTPSSMSQFIRIGDHVYKPINSDSIFIFRNSKKYFFLLGQRIGNECQKE
nr:hypothetical protein [uncultured Carboxylicivirga sp.]